MTINYATNNYSTVLGHDKRLSVDNGEPRQGKCSPYYNKCAVTAIHFIQQSQKQRKSKNYKKERFGKMNPNFIRRNNINNLNKNNNEKNEEIIISWKLL